MAHSKLFKLFFYGLLFAALTNAKHLHGQAFQNAQLASYDAENDRLWFSWETVSEDVATYTFVVTDGNGTETTFGPTSSFTNLGTHADYVSTGDGPHHLRIIATLNGGGTYEEVIWASQVENFEVSSYNYSSSRLFVNWENTANVTSTTFYATDGGGNNFGPYGPTTSKNGTGDRNDYFSGLDTGPYVFSLVCELSNGLIAKDTILLEQQPAFENFEIVSYDLENQRVYFSWNNLSSYQTQMYIIQNIGTPSEIISGPASSIAALGPHTDYTSYTTFPSTLTLRGDISNGQVYEETLTVAQIPFQDFAIDGYDLDANTISFSWENISEGIGNLEYYTKIGDGNWELFATTGSYSGLGEQSDYIGIPSEALGSTFSIKLRNPGNASTSEYELEATVALPEIAFADFEITHYDSDNQRAYYNWENVSSNINELYVVLDINQPTEAVGGPYTSIVAPGSYSDYVTYSTFPSTVSIQAQLTNGTYYTATIDPLPAQEYENLTVDAYNTENKTLTVSWNNLTGNASYFQFFTRESGGSWVNRGTSNDNNAAGAQTATFNFSESDFGKTLDVKVEAKVAGPNADYSEITSVTLPSVAFQDLQIYNYDSDNKRVYFSWENIESSISSIYFTFDEGLPTEQTVGPTTSFNGLGEKTDYINYTTFPQTFSLTANLNNGTAYRQTIDPLPKQEFANFIIADYNTSDQTITITFENLTGNAAWHEVYTRIGSNDWSYERSNTGFIEQGSHTWTFPFSEAWLGQTMDIRLFTKVNAINGNYYEHRTVTFPEQAIQNLNVTHYETVNDKLFFAWENASSNITEIYYIFDEGLSSEEVRGPYTSIASSGNKTDNLTYSTFPQTLTLRARLNNGLFYSKKIDLPEYAIHNIQQTNYLHERIDFNWTNLSNNITKIEINTNVDNGGWQYAWATTSSSVTGAGDKSDYVSYAHDSRLSDLIGKEIKLRIIASLSDGKEFRDEVTLNNFKPFDDFRLSYSPAYGVIYADWTNIVGVEDVWVVYDGTGIPLDDAAYNPEGAQQQDFPYNISWFDLEYPTVQLAAIYNGVTYSESLTINVPALEDIAFSYDETHDELRVDWHTNGVASYLNGSFSDHSINELIAEYNINSQGWNTSFLTEAAYIDEGAESYVLSDNPIPGAPYRLGLHPRTRTGNISKETYVDIDIPVKDEFAISALTANFQGDETQSPVTIKLNWKAPTDLAKWSNLPNFEGYYKIYRREREAGGSYGAWTLLTANFGFGDDFSTTPEYTDTDNLDYCKQYTYSLEMWGTYNGGDEFHIKSVLAEDIKSNGAQDPPSNLQATTDRCDSGIKLTWEWYQKNPDEFRIEQLQVNENDTVTVSINYVLGEDRSYAFENVTKNQWYLFKMTTRGFCGYLSSTPSKIVSGFSPDEPSPASDVVVSFTEDPFEITLEWTDNSINEEQFVVERIETGGAREEFYISSSVAESEATGRTVSFKDDNITNCAEYTYKVYAWNGCSSSQYGTEPLNEVVIRPSLSLTEIFTSESLTTSKGYFKSYVDLKFEPFGNYQKARKFKIYNRELGSNILPQLVASLDIEERQYQDYTTEAGVLYEYFIIAERDCGDGFVYSYDISGFENQNFEVGFNLPEGVGYAVGFRSPTGIINGNITYAGGVAVQNVKVAAERETGQTGTALNFTGNDYVHIPYQSSLQPESQMTVSAWVLPENTTGFSGQKTIIRKWNNYTLALDNGRIMFAVVDANGDWRYLFVDTEEVLVQDRYAYIAGVVDGTHIRLYVDGEEVANDGWPSGLGIYQDESHLYIGGLGESINNFQGKIDEVRLYHRALSELEILQSYGRMIAEDSEGLMGYWKLNEGIGPYIFDASKKGNVYHKNEGRVYGAEWSYEIPTVSQLGFAGFTNSNGNYTIEGVEYRGTGENFKVIPTITMSGSVHEFDPEERIIFIGEGNTVQNGVDFEDISSFEVTGKVLFQFGENNSGSEGVSFYIDGIPVSDGFGELIKSDENGEFTIQVPIGLHKITVQKGFHTFENEGVWPPNNIAYDFQEPVSGITFWDQTTRKVVGRVVGGTREAEKKIGFGKSVNNIGQAQFKLVSQDGLISHSISTDATTGEYEAELPPKVYNILRISDSQAGIEIPSNLTITFGALQNVDLSQVPSEQIERDTLEDNTVAEYEYHLKRNFIYRSVPEVTVTEGNADYEGSELLGKRSVSFTQDDVELEVDVIDNNAYVLGRPVYRMYQKEGVRIAISETYINNDGGSPVEDVVPVSDAKVNITNTIGLGYFTDGFGKQQNYPAGATEEIQLNDPDGDTLYTFTPDEPNLTINASDPSLSYTRVLAISVTAGGNTVYWPNPSNSSEVLYAYVMGSRGTTTSFITAAPDLVDFVLRDPPGSNSYAFIEQGQTFSQSSTMSLAYEDNFELEAGVGVGLNTLVGGGICGVGEVFELSLEATTGFNISVEQGEEEEFVETFEFTQAFSTNDDNINVGAQGDLFIGKSANFRYGISDNLVFVPASDCNKPEVLCADGFPSVFAADGTEFKLARKYGFYLVPDGVPTYFIYSQNHIENYLIPDLITLRNSILSSNANYTTSISGEDERYGTNNDDPVWGSDVSSANPFTTETADLSGMSYTFTPQTESDVDSVRWYNQQIRLWQEELARNEEEKHGAIQNGSKDNYSFSAGASLSSATTFTQSGTYTQTYELALGMNQGVSAELDGYGVSLSLEMEAAINETHSMSSSITNESSVTYGFELNDGDVGDFFSVDVIDGQNGNGPVFSILGGQTMCPHEDEVVSKYYNPGTVLSARTLQREKPKLSVAVAEVFNVPADEAAVFTLTLANESESFDDQIYALKVIEGTNPNGAVLKIDGVAFSGSREFLVPGSGAINKTLTMERGPFEYDYENIEIQIQSMCQNDPTDNDIDIVDRVTIAAHFIPTCTQATILSPSNQWIVNNNFDNVLPIAFGEYNVNYEGFQKVQLQYKPSSQSQWILLEEFYRNQAAANADGKSNPVFLADQGNVTTYNWELGELPDGNYDLRVVSVCDLANSESEIFSGLIDRTNPELFGSTQPSDGILSYGDEIMVQFTEVINEALLVPTNFKIQGVLNGTEIRHDASIFFNGTPANYMEVPAGFDFKKKSFTIEMYVKRAVSNQAEVLFSQGTSATTGFTIGIGADNKPYFSMAGKSLTATSTITDNKWHHLAFMVDESNSNAEIYINAISDNVDNEFFTDYQESGKIFIARPAYDGNTQNFEGNIHELRIWDKALPPGTLAQVAVKQLSRTEPSLIGNWRLDEVHGNVAEDHVSFRHAKVLGTWSMEPGGRALGFGGSNSIFEVTSPAFANDGNFTIELWFNTDDSKEMTFWSNGKGDGTDSNPTGWSLGMNTAGKVTLASNEKSITSSNSYNNGLWHHAALVVNQAGSSILYVDGNQEGLLESNALNGFGGPALWIGARGWFEGSIEYHDNYFSGTMDEIRVWNYAKTLDQIELYQYNQLLGSEPGLVMYYPFETYQDLGGVQVVIETTVNQSNGDYRIEGNESLIGDINVHELAATIKLARPVKNVNFSYASNTDKIIFTILDEDNLIENTTLEISVENVQDLNGNTQPAPIVWNAFVDRNQVDWIEDGRNLELKFGEGFTFETSISNGSGEVYSFNIDNIPSWLTVTPSSGVLNPLTSRVLTIEIDPDINVGNYEQNLFLQTEFGFDEKFALHVDVSKPLPNGWEVNPADFEYSMNLIAQVQIGNVISRDENVIVAAFVGDEIRGVEALQYIAPYDNYQAFMTIHSNVQNGEVVIFKVWNASEGRIHSNITPKINFEENTTLGLPTSPLILVVPNYLELTYDLVKGWQWISFNVASDHFANVNTFMQSVSGTNGDIIKSQYNFDQYDVSTGWFGSLTANGGLNNQDMYKVNVGQASQLTFSGAILDPETVVIDVASGWNWVGFVSQRNIDINEALAGFSATEGDEIKSQTDFAIYTGVAYGWIGSLNTLEPGKGYMLKSDQVGSFTYPAIGIISGSRISRNTSDTEAYQNALEKVEQMGESFNPYAFADNMDVIAQSQSGNYYEFLVAKSNGQVREVALPVYNPILDKHQYFFTIGGTNSEEVIEFFALHEGELVQVKTNQPLVYANNRTIGNINEPVWLDDSNITAGNNLELQVHAYPNPVGDHLNLSIQNIKAEEVTIELYNATGQKLVSRTFDSVDNQRFSKKLDVQSGYDWHVLSKGLYIIRVLVKDEVKIIEVIR